jgi:hypothetical protein
MDRKGAHMVSKIKFLFLQQPITAATLALLLLSLIAHSRAQDDTTPYTVNAGAGVSALVGAVSSRLNDGWHITFGAGYNFTKHFYNNPRLHLQRLWCQSKCPERSRCTEWQLLVPANEVIGRIIADGVGGSLGGGFDIKLGDSGVKFFSEARYHYANTGRIVTRMVPVTFGIRW